MGWFIFDLSMAVLGYVASIYTWPMLRTQVQGVQAEISALEDRIIALKTTVIPPPVTPVKKP